MTATTVSLGLCNSITHKVNISLPGFSFLSLFLQFSKELFEFTSGELTPRYHTHTNTQFKKGNKHVCRYLVKFPKQIYLPVFCCLSAHRLVSYDLWRNILKHLNSSLLNAYTCLTHGLIKSGCLVG